MLVGNPSSQGIKILQELGETLSMEERKGKERK